MSCPTCGHTLQLLFMDTNRTIHHCPRCGTTRSVLFGHTADTVPSLVVRCREFAEALSNPALGAAGANMKLLWHSGGVEESIRCADHITN